MYPGEDGDLAPYDEDGASADHESGKGAGTTALHWGDASGTLTASGSDNVLARAVSGLLKMMGR